MITLHLAGVVGLCTVVAYGKPTAPLQRISSLFGCPYCLATWLGPLWAAALAHHSGLHGADAFAFAIAFGFAAALAAFGVACVYRGFELAGEAFAAKERHRKETLEVLAGIMEVAHKYARGYAPPTRGDGGVQ